MSGKGHGYGKMRQFRFKGVDGDGNPIIVDKDGTPIPEHPAGPADPDKLELAAEIFVENPTWIKIGGRWYCIGC